MVNYVRNAATAKRLIEASGRDVTLYRKSRAPLDAAKPWRGPDSAQETAIGPVKAVLYPIDEKDVVDGLIRLGMQKAMVAHTSLLTPQDLRDIDTLVDDGRMYKVVKANVLNPGTVIIAYEFFLEE
jgi:hypothetical protein